MQLFWEALLMPLEENEAILLLRRDRETRSALERLRGPSVHPAFGGAEAAEEAALSMVNSG